MRIVLLLAVLPSPSFAQAAAKLTLRAEASQTQVAVGDELQLDITLVVDGTSGDPSFSAPELEGLEVVRRSTQRGQSFTMNFGSTPKVQLSTTYTYLLRATKPGKAKIGQASARLGSDLVTTEPIVIEVSGSGSAQAQPPAQKQIPAPQGGRTDAVMLQVVPSKYEAFVGEQVVLSVFLLSRVDLSDVSGLTQPQLEGVLLERDDRPRQNLQPKIQRFGGEEYQVFEIARFALFPLRDGKTTVGSFNTEAQAGGLFFSQGRSYKVSSAPIDITVKPLPAAGKPAGFSPMNVGQFEFNAQLLNGPMQVGKPITLRMVASGVGNVSKLSLPAPRFSSKLRAYDPETKSEQRFEQGVLAGRMQRDYLFVPSEPGEHLIPALVFNSFDPKTGTYQEQKSLPFSVQVGGTAAADNGAAPQASSTNKRDEDGRHLHPIRYTSELKDDRPAPAKVWFVWLGGGSSALAGLSLVLMRLRRREKSSEEIARGAKARAQKGLRQSKGETREVYAELSRITRQYLFERFGISIGTGRDALRMALLKQGIADAPIDRLLTELDNCDFARFAPGGHLAKEAQGAAQRLDDALSLIDKAERS